MRVEQLSLQVRIDRVLCEHSHPVYELHYVVEGRAAFEHRGEPVAVGAGDLFYTLPGARHRMHGNAGAGVLQYVALFTPRTDLAVALRAWPSASVHPVGLGWQGLFHRLSEWQQGGELQRRLAASRLEALLYQVLVQRAAGSGAPPPPAVEAMRDHIQATLDRPLAMAELAAVAGLDPAYASRLFKRHLGVPPVRWATHQRLARAAAWLRGSDEPVRVIAGRVGFDDPYHFSRAFKRWSGHAPERYRAQA